MVKGFFTSQPDPNGARLVSIQITLTDLRTRLLTPGISDYQKFALDLNSHRSPL